MAAGTDDTEHDGSDRAISLRTSLRQIGRAINAEMKWEIRRSACLVSPNGSYLRYGSSVIASAKGRHLARADSVA
jgi:hypothetical protein